MGKGRLEVLRGLDLTVAEGDLVAVLGASGVGKSTLLHLLGALDRPDAGDYAFGGKALFSATDSELADFRNREVGFIFQFHHLLPEFTAEENVLMPGLIGGLSPDARQHAHGSSSPTLGWPIAWTTAPASSPAASSSASPLPGPW